MRRSQCRGGSCIESCKLIESEISECADETAAVTDGSFLGLRLAAKLGVKSDVTQKSCASLRAARVCYAQVIARHPTFRSPLTSQRIPRHLALADVWSGARNAVGSDRL
jgi:hypothetical protein